MSQSALIQVRIDDELKRQADALFSNLGFDTPTAIRMFLKQAVMRDGLPFEVSRQSTPNAETIAAIMEAERISRDPKTKRYSSFSALLADVEGEADHEV